MTGCNLGDEGLARGRIAWPAAPQPAEREVRSIAAGLGLEAQRCQPFPEPGVQLAQRLLPLAHAQPDHAGISRVGNHTDAAERDLEGRQVPAGVVHRHADPVEFRLVDVVSEKVEREVHPGRVYPGGLRTGSPETLDDPPGLDRGLTGGIDRDEQPQMGRHPTTRLVPGRFVPQRV